MSELRVIQCNAASGTLVWKYPFPKVVGGSVIAVQQNQIAGLYANCVRLYTLESGKTVVVDSEQLPNLANVSFAGANGLQMYTFDILYANIAIQLNVNWSINGKSDGLLVADAHAEEPQAINANGQCRFKIDDAGVFLDKIVGAQLPIDPPQIYKFVQNQIQGSVIDVIKSVVKDKQYTIQQIMAERSEFCSLVQTALNDELHQKCGLGIVDFSVGLLGAGDIENPPLMNVNVPTPSVVPAAAVQPAAVQPAAVQPAADQPAVAQSPVAQPPVAQPSPYAYDSDSDDEEDGGNKSHTLMIVLLCLLGLILIGGGVGGYFYYQKQQEELELKLERERERAEYEQEKAMKAQEEKEAAEQEKLKLEEDIQNAKAAAQQNSSNYNYSTPSYSSGSNSSSSYYPSRVRVTGVHVRLRTSPTTYSNDNIVKYSNGVPVYPEKGEVLECVGQASDFYKVRYMGYTYYISKQFTEPY